MTTTAFRCPRCGWWKSYSDVSPASCNACPNCLYNQLHYVRFTEPETVEALRILLTPTNAEIRTLISELGHVPTSSDELKKNAELYSNLRLLHEEKRHERGQQTDPVS